MVQRQAAYCKTVQSLLTESSHKPIDEETTKCPERAITRKRRRKSSFEVFEPYEGEGERDFDIEETDASEEHNSIDEGSEDASFASECAVEQLTLLQRRAFIDRLEARVPVVIEAGSSSEDLPHLASCIRTSLPSVDLSDALHSRQDG